MDLPEQGRDVYKSDTEQAESETDEVLPPPPPPPTQNSTTTDQFTSQDNQLPETPFMLSYDFSTNLSYSFQSANALKYISGWLTTTFFLHRLLLHVVTFASTDPRTVI